MKNNDTSKNTFDVIIIGGGPAGLSAAIYSARAGKATLVLERLACGGQINMISDIQNYPGNANIDGIVLAQNMLGQAEGFGARIEYDAAVRIEARTAAGAHKVYTASGAVYAAPSVIVATGARAKKLGLEREDELTGAGVSYCATCDGNFFRGRDVAVAGGGKKAVEEALYLAALCRKVYIVSARPPAAPAPELEKLKAASNVEHIAGAITALEGMPLSGVTLDSGRRLDVSGLFVAVGTQSETALLKDSGLALDAKGFVVTDGGLKTNVAGIFAAGDVRSGSARQIVTACAEGATAAMSVT